MFFFLCFFYRLLSKLLILLSNFHQNFIWRSILGSPIRKSETDLQETNLPYVSKMEFHTNKIKVI